MEAPMRGSSAYPLSSTRVLVVDSHPLLRWAMTEHVAEHSDLPPVAVTTAADAVREIGAQDFGAAILDGTLPEVRNGRLITQLRETKPDLALVVLNAPAAAEQPVIWGATCYLPLDAD